MFDDNEIPLLFVSRIKETKKTVVQKFKKDGEDIKVLLHEFSNDGEESAELLLTLIKDFDSMVATYDLFNELTVTKVIDRFK